MERTIPSSTVFPFSFEDQVQLLMCVTRAEFRRRKQTVQNNRSQSSWSVTVKVWLDSPTLELTNYLLTDATEVTELLLHPNRCTPISTDTYHQAISSFPNRLHTSLSHVRSQRHIDHQ
jgi:hypothetical protein